jgi:radical SAM superfamily enzyme YgiQ (UPF0313 family)
MNVLLIYPEFPDTFWSFKHALKFVSKKASSPPLGLVTVAAMLPKNWNKRLTDLNVSPLKSKDLEWADLVLISAMVVQRESTKEVISLCKTHNKKIVAGGPLFTGEPEQFTEVDYLILNEAEITLPLFLSDLERGDPQPIYQTDEYADMSLTPVPMWELINMKAYDSMSIQFTRGCPFNCDFCNITALLGHKVRTKTATQILAELDKIYSLGWRRSIFFVDDNFIGNKRLIKEEILPALIKWRVGKSGCGFLTEASINLADDEELIDMMTKAGFNSVFVGIETPDETCLTEAHKSQNKNRNLVDSVIKLHKKGLQVMGGFIVGFDNDTTSIFQRQIDFIQKTGIVTAMVGILQAPYGTQLYKRLQEENRLSVVPSGDNTNGSTNIIPKMDIKTLTDGYRHIISQIYSPKLFYERVKNFISQYEPVSAPVNLQFEELSAFIRSIYLLGIKAPNRKYYWKLFFWTLFNHPSKFPLAITFSIYGYHFQRVGEAILPM